MFHPKQDHRIVLNNGDRCVSKNFWGVLPEDRLAHRRIWPYRHEQNGPMVRAYRKTSTNLDNVSILSPHSQSAPLERRTANVKPRLLPKTLTCEAAVWRGLVSISVNHCNARMVHIIRLVKYVSRSSDTIAVWGYDVVDIPTGRIRANTYARLLDGHYLLESKGVFAEYAFGIADLTHVKEADRRLYEKAKWHAEREVLRIEGAILEDHTPFKDSLDS